LKSNTFFFKKTQKEIYNFGSGRCGRIGQNGFQMDDYIKQAYDPDHFRAQGHQMIDLLADYLQQLQQDPDAVPAIDWIEPEDSLEAWSKYLEDRNSEDWGDLFQQVLQKSVHVHHPRYMGHQMSPTAPVSALAGFLGDFLNNGMGVFEMGVVSTTIERLVISKVAEQMGMGLQAGGFLTSGGTLGNLTALLCARSRMATERIWTEGGGHQLALMVSEQAHYCVDRAARIMGWGEAGIIKVPVNERYQMRTELLKEYYENARLQGRQVIAVVGSACTTSTGSFDNLEAIAEFCEEHHLWFHIDGAHGAATVFSPTYKKLVKGLEKADSVVMDFHKMLLTPSITTALVFKREEDSYRTFAQKAQYLWEAEEEREWFNLAKRTFECTKLMLSLKVYAILKTYGTQLWEEYVTKVIDTGRRFGQLVEAHPHFELATSPECNIVCFRYVPSGEHDLEHLNQVNEKIRQHLLEEGTFYIVKTNLEGALWLRCTFTNPFTTEEDLLSLLRSIK
jgi:L-2,4-diaminobutyrate decarboxylase